jgi:type II secretory pathway component PulM
VEIAEKLADALTMFWQALDERERRLLALGVAWLVAMIALAPVERSRRQRERDEIAQRVALYLKENHA